MDNTSNSYPDIVSQSVLYQKLMEEPINERKNRLEKDKKELERQTKKIKTAKAELVQEALKLLNWETKLMEHKKCQEEATRILTEADLEHEHQMIAEFAVIADEKEKIQREIASVIKERVEFEKICQLKAKLLNLGPGTIRDLESLKMDLQQIIKDFLTYNAHY